jgi:hypothetical protein
VNAGLRAFHSGPFLADVATRSLVRSGGMRVLSRGLVVCLVASVWRAHADRTRAAAVLLPANLVGTFALVLLALDVIELEAATSFEQSFIPFDRSLVRPDAASHLDTLAVISELFGLVTIGGLAFVAVLAASIAARTRSASSRTAWGQAWALFVVLGLSTSARLAPSLDGPMQTPASPASLGAEADFEALVRPRDLETLAPLDFSGTFRGIGLLTATGELRTATGLLTRYAVPVGDFDYPGRPHDRMAAELLVDRRATLAHLLRAARSLRAFDAVFVGARVRTELDGSPLARARWGVLELASRAVLGREVRLVEASTTCGPPIELAGARYADCLDAEGSHVRVLRDPGGLTLEDWLDTPAEGDDWIAIEISRQGLVSPFSAELVWPHDPPSSTSQLGQSWTIAPIAALLALLVALGLRRDAPAWLWRCRLFDLPRPSSYVTPSPYRTTHHPHAARPLTDVGALVRSWIAPLAWLAATWALAHLASWMQL